jgi:uncharacterized protein (TIGR02646 family)
MSLIKYQKLNKAFKLGASDSIFLGLLLKVAGGKAWDKKLDTLIKAGSLPADATSKRKRIKDDIKKQILLIQGNYCIYCGLHFDLSGVSEREHIAHKAKYPQFTFQPLNIALACHFCNGPLKKGTKDTITTLNRKYSKCKFKIVHPYFDNFFNHIEASTKGADLLFSPKSGSSKGAETIKMFKLMNGKQAEMRGAAVLKKKYETGILPKYDKLRNEILNNSYIS